MAEIRCLNAQVNEEFAAYNGDCVDVVRQMPDNSIDFAVYSPPFSGLYIYNDSVADMGNCADDAEFSSTISTLQTSCSASCGPEGWSLFTAGTWFTTGRSEARRGCATSRRLDPCPYSGRLRLPFSRHHLAVPGARDDETKAHGLLYKQLRRSDSSFSRQGLPEYLVVFRKWAEEAQEDLIRPVTHTHESFPLPQWQEYASPVWMDTRETDVLNASREPTDEKHICPMPLDITTRACTLWSNEGDTVLSPFMGIGSEGYAALKLRRKFVGVELKESYWRQAVRHLTSVGAQPDLSPPPNPKPAIAAGIPRGTIDPPQRGSRCESREQLGQQSMKASNAMHPSQAGGELVSRALRTLNLRLGASHWELQ